MFVDKRMKRFPRINIAESLLPLVTYRERGSFLRVRANNKILSDITSLRYTPKVFSLLQPARRQRERADRRIDKRYDGRV